MLAGGWSRDLTAARRAVVRQPWLAAAAVLSLTLAFAGTTAAFSLLWGVVLSPLPFSHSEKLLKIEAFSSTDPVGGAVTAGVFELLDRPVPLLDGVSAACRREFEVEGLADAQGPERVQGAMVTADFFSVLGSEPALGRGFLSADVARDAPPPIVLDHGFWLRRFGGDAGVLGRSLTVDGETYLIAGVMGPRFLPLPRGVAFWTPAPESVPLGGGFLNSREALDRAGATWSLGYLDVIARRAPGFDRAAVEGHLGAMTRRLRREVPEMVSAEGFRLQATDLRESVVGGIRATLLWLVQTALLVLVIAAANVTLLLIVRNLDRQRDFAVRLALGGSRWRLFRQALVEGAVLGGLSAGAGLLAASWLVQGFRNWVPAGVPRLREVHLAGPEFAFALALASASAVLFAAVPILTSGRPSLGSLLQSSGGSPGLRPSAVKARVALLLVQVALAVALVIGAGSMVESLWRLGRLDGGYEPRGLLVVRVEGAAPTAGSSLAFRQLTEGAAALGQVTTTSLGSDVPFSGQSPEVPFFAEPDPGVREEPLQVGWRVVAPGFFEVLGVPLLDGRDFAATDLPSPVPVAIVSSSAARAFWPEGKPLGRRLSIFTPGGQPWWATVVGVVGDIRYRSLRQPPAPAVYFALPQNPQPALFLVARAEDRVGDSALGELYRRIDQLWTAGSVQGPWSGEGMAEGEIASLRSYTVILVVLGLCALLLAAVGIFGTVSYGVSRQAFEHGVRLALGATRRSIAARVLVRSLLLVAMGSVLGWGLSLLGSRLVASVLFGVEPGDPVLLVGATLLLLVVGSLAALPAAYRASRADPSSLLRGG